MSMMSSVGRNGGGQKLWRSCTGGEYILPRCKFNFVRDVHLTLILDFH